MCEYACCLALFLHLSLQCILWNKVFLVWKLYWSCSVFEMIICNTRFLSPKFGHSDYTILTFKAEFVCPACSDFITSSYLNAPEALKLHTNGFSLYYYDIHCVHCYKRPHLTWPQFWCHTAHTWIKTIFWWWKQLLETYHFLMVRLKIAYWEFDFKAVCPTLDHDLLSQAHIYCNSIFPWYNRTGWLGVKHQFTYLL